MYVTIDEEKIFEVQIQITLVWWHKVIRTLTFTKIKLTVMKIHPKNKKVCFIDLVNHILIAGIILIGIFIITNA